MHDFAWDDGEAQGKDFPFCVILKNEVFGDPARRVDFSLPIDCKVGAVHL